jgi:hypothetical protein
MRLEGGGKMGCVTVCEMDGCHAGTRLVPIVCQAVPESGSVLRVRPALAGAAPRHLLPNKGITYIHSDFRSVSACCKVRGMER